MSTKKTKITKEDVEKARKEGFKEGQRIAREALDARITALDAQCVVDQLALNAVLRFADSAELPTPAARLGDLFKEAKDLAKKAVQGGKASGPTEWIKRMKEVVFAAEIVVKHPDAKLSPLLKSRMAGLKNALRQVQPS